MFTVNVQYNVYLLLKPISVHYNHQNFYLTNLAYLAWVGGLAWKSHLDICEVGGLAWKSHRDTCEVGGLAWMSHLDMFEVGGLA